jgi:hypothetical protein
MHIFRYTTNVHLMNFSLHFTVLRLSYRHRHQYVCVLLLNIILTPHLVGLVTMRLAWNKFFAAVWFFFFIRICASSFSAMQNWFFFHSDCITLFQFMNTIFFLATVQKWLFLHSNCIKASLSYLPTKKSYISRFITGIISFFFARSLKKFSTYQF